MTEVEAIAAAIRASTFHYRNEDEFQRGIAHVLTDAGLHPVREVRLNPSDRIDMMIGRIGIEVKIKGSAADTRRQLTRYAQTGMVDQLILVSTKAFHRPLHGQVLNGVPITVVRPPWL